LIVVSPGVYRHYKGQQYEVLGIARHSETEEEFVVYRALYGDRGLWIRPLAMFTESVEKEGVSVPRFSRIDKQTGEDETISKLFFPRHDGAYFA
jgi:hypothetical protein